MKVSEREVRDLTCTEFRTTVVAQVYQVCCLDCGIRMEKVPRRGANRRWVQMGVDEIYLVKKQKFITVASNLDSSEPLCLATNAQRRL